MTHEHDHEWGCRGIVEQTDENNVLVEWECYVCGVKMTELKPITD